MQGSFVHLELLALYGCASASPASCSPRNRSLLASIRIRQDKAMNSIVRAAYTQWAHGQRRVLDDEDGDSDGSSSPLVTRQLAPGAVQKELPGSPRRNGMVLDANLRSIFSMRAAGDLRSQSRSPDKCQGCERSRLLSCQLFREDLVDSLSSPGAEPHDSRQRTAAHPTVALGPVPSICKLRHVLAERIEHVKQEAQPGTSIRRIPSTQTALASRASQRCDRVPVLGPFCTVQLRHRWQ